MIDLRFVLIVLVLSVVKIPILSSGLSFGLSTGLDDASPFFGAAWASEFDNTAPPEVLDIDDPFSRDLKRAAEDATGGISFGGDGLIVTEEEKTGKDLLGRESRNAIIASKYRVMGVAVSHKSQQNQIYVNPRPDIIPGARPLMNYLRIGTHDTIDEAHQHAINIKSAHGGLLDAAFVIRQAQDSAIVDLDIGPFREISHGERYCDMMLALTFGLINECYVVQEYPGIEPIESFTSTAMMRFSADAVGNVITDTSIFDLPAAADQIITVHEGDTIGAGTTQIVKIMDGGIIVIDESGTLANLPLIFIPEDAYTEGVDDAALLESLPLGDIAPVLNEDGTEGPGVIQEEPQTAAEILLSTE